MQMTREFYVPKGATKIAMKNAKCEFYVHDVNGIPYGMCFIGRAKKPTWNYRFRNTADRAARIEATMQGVVKSEEFKRQRAEARKQPHDFKVGEVLCGTWGYEQTNVDFFEVVEIIGVRTVKIEKIGAASVKETGWASDKVVAAPEFRTGEIYKVRVTEGSCKSPVHGYLSKYDGHPVHRSWYG